MRKKTYRLNCLPNKKQPVVAAKERRVKKLVNFIKKSLKKLKKLKKIDKNLKCKPTVDEMQTSRC